MVCYFKGKQTTFVQSNKTQVHLLCLISLTYKVHILAVLRSSSVKKTVNIRRGPLEIIVYFCICSCVDMPEYCLSISRNMWHIFDGN